MASERIFSRGQSRVFLQASGAGPGHAVEYLGLARVGGFSESLGDVTPVRVPSRISYDRFDVIGETRGDAGLPTTSIVARFGLVNPIMRMTCPGHLQCHFGKCQDPQDFNGGWDKIIAFEHFYLTSRSSDDLGALDSGENETISLTGEITARQLWEVDPLTLAARAGEEALLEVVDVVVSDYISCGECGYESDGVQRIFALVKGSGSGSPGLPAELLVSEDQGATWSQYDITTLTGTEQPSALAVVGVNVVVVSNGSGSLHFAPLSDLSSWTEVTTGFVSAGKPNAIFSLSSTQTWIAADGGYIYFTTDPTQGVEVQADGSLSAENLNAIHAVDSRNLVAMGDNGAVLMTANGGNTWSLSDTSPTLNDITCCWMRTDYCWFAGDNAGHLWYTRNGGVSWAELRFAGVAGTGSIGDIVFADHPDCPFGFLAHNTGTSGVIYRTLDGGQSWYALPEKAGVIPANDRIVSLSCGVGPSSPNFVVGGGLADDATSGIVIVGS